MTTWAAQVTAQIDGVRAEIADLTAWAYRTDMPEASRELMLAPWRRWLAELEGAEMAAARAADASGRRGRRDVIVEDLDRGVPIYRRVLVGYVPRGPGGLPMCTVCNEREVYRRSSRYCGSECRMSVRRRKARWMPCPVCLRACIKCGRGQECRAVWVWRSRTPVHRDTRQPLHLRIEGAL